jgi:hypothetical protein
MSLRRMISSPAVTPAFVLLLAGTLMGLAIPVHAGGTAAPVGKGPCIDPNGAPAPDGCTKIAKRPVPQPPRALADRSGRP